MSDSKQETLDHRAEWPTGFSVIIGIIATLLVGFGFLTWQLSILCPIALSLGLAILNWRWQKNKTAFNGGLAKKGAIYVIAVGTFSILTGFILAKMFGPFLASLGLLGFSLILISSIGLMITYSYSPQPALIFTWLACLFVGLLIIQNIVVSELALVATNELFPAGG